MFANILIASQDNPSVSFATAPLCKGSLFYVHLWLINFSDKYCICVQKCKIRHTSFEIYRIFENCPLEYAPKKPSFLNLSDKHLAVTFRYGVAVDYLADAIGNDAPRFRIFNGVDMSAHVGINLGIFK